ncbi:MAG: hypothetical protein LBF92_00955 [Synergistaceae bacterium]|nr:hypothetical protein [Synergistaceae bacterium]
MAEIIKQEAHGLPIGPPVHTGIPRIGGTAALLRFDSAYIREEAKVSGDACALIEEALDLLRKASNHDRWRCKERFRIDDDLYRIEQLLEKTTDELSDIASALKNGAERFAELEERAASQESEINAELRKTWGFEADVWDPGQGRGIPKPPIPTPVPDPVDPIPDPEPDPLPPDESDSDTDPPDDTESGGGDDDKGRGRGRRWHRVGRRPGRGPIPIRIQPLPVWPPQAKPIIIYVPSDVIAQSGGAMSYSGASTSVSDITGGVSTAASNVTGGMSGGYAPAASAASPVTFSYPGSPGGSYGASSFGSTGFFSSGATGNSSAGNGNSSMNELLSMLLAWLTQMLSGQNQG